MTVEYTAEELIEMDDPKCLYHFLHYEDYFNRWSDLTPFIEFYCQIGWYSHVNILLEFKSQYNND